MEYKVKTLTKDGVTMFAQADAQKQPVVIDKMVISDNQVDSNSDLTGLTINDFTNNHEFDTNNTTQNDSSFTVVSIMTNKGFTADYSVNLIGLLAHIGTDTDNEKIIAVATGDNPFSLPQDTGTPVQLVPAFTTAFGTATNVTVTVANEAYVLKADLDNLIKLDLNSYTPTSKLTNYIASNLPADVAKTDEANTFTEQQTLKGGAVDGSGNKYVTENNVPKTDLTGLQPKGDYATHADVNGSLAAYAKTVDVNQQLDKKVNIADMRKPASDVVGLEDVSTVVNQGQVASNTDLHTIKTEGVYNLAGTYVNAPFTAGVYGMLQVLSKGTVIFHIIYAHNFVYVEELGGAPALWSNWVQFADDSQVPHLSGANNFDTVPTVNNNPLLLASSLPSDLARTGQDANFTGKLQKSGIDVATTTDVSNAVSTATTDATNKANSAQQAAINQAKIDLTSELTKRGYPSAIWTGTQAQYDAMASHDANTEYRITG